MSPNGIDEKDRRRALRSMQGVWRDLVGQLVDQCVNNAEDLARMNRHENAQGGRDTHYSSLGSGSTNAVGQSLP